MKWLVTMTGPTPTGLRYAVVPGYATTYIVHYATDRDLHNWMQTPDRSLYHVERTEPSAEPPVSAEALSRTARVAAIEAELVIQRPLA